MKNQVREIIVKSFYGVVLIFAFSCKSETRESALKEAPASNSIILNEAQKQLANISTAEVRVGSIGRKFSLTGVLKVNEQTAVNVSARIKGRVERLFFRNTGETVRKGDKLYEFYSEELVSAQREYFRLQSNNWNFNAKYEPSLAIEERMRVMGLTPDQIKQLGNDGKILFTVTILSPYSGKIRSVNVSEGQYVEQGQSLFELADDNTLWAEAQVYPDDIRYLGTGMAAVVIIPAVDETPVLCKISFINPSIETGKNITLVRAIINNPDYRLHPGMLVILSVKAQTRKGLIIPSEAVITDSDGSRVWVMGESGEFTPRTIITGIQTADSILVLSGINQSDRIVTTGAYLLDSELILKQGIDYRAGTKKLIPEEGHAKIEPAGL